MNTQTHQTSYAVTVAICEALEVKLEHVFGRLQSAKVCRARHVAMYFMRDQLQLPLRPIARFFNRDNHTTVINAYNNVEHMIKHDREFQKDWPKLIRAATKARKATQA